MTSDGTRTDCSPDQEPDAGEAHVPAQHTRRELVRCSVKLAFVVPILSTFFAKDAYAASYSCYPAGHACDAPRNEPCCSGSCNAVTDTCDP